MFADTERPSGLKTRPLPASPNHLDTAMNDGVSEQRNIYSDLPSGDVGGPEITVTAEQAMQASRAQVAALEVELAEMRDRWMRAEAETANVKARSKKDLEDAKQYGTQKFAADAVEAAENLRRGLDSVPHMTSGQGPFAQLRDGFVGVERSFIAMLGRNGIKRHDPTGHAFDAATQQAMASEESAAHPPGTVMRALTSTWTLNGRLLRPAMVVVSKPTTTNAHSPPY
jgi:molecular chaperone GrpE